MADPLRMAVLIKQIPAFEAMTLGPDGRLRREGLALELNPYCRRAVAQAVALAQERPGSEIVVATLGPPSADDALREAIAWGAARGVDMRGVHASDPVFAGSDTLATARALAAAVRREGPFDLVLLGRNSVDADTGQVGPEVAELLGLPFLTAVRYLSIEAGVAHARCEHDDGWLQVDVDLPVVASCAERLIDPAKVDPQGRAAVDAARIVVVDAEALGPGPWGAAGSPTWVGAVRVLETLRARNRWPDLDIAEQVVRAAEVLRERGVLRRSTEPGDLATVEAATEGRPVAVVVEPDRATTTRELLGEAARLGGPVTAITLDTEPDDRLRGWGADAVVVLDGANVEEDVAAALAEWARRRQPWAILAGSTAWGREVSARAAAALDAGLTGDAVELEVDPDGRLVAWKSAFGGQLVAAIHCSSPVQMVTVRAGVLARRPARHSGHLEEERAVMTARRRVRVLARSRDDDLDRLADADAVIGVGRGVPPEDYSTLEPLRALLGAELGATRKVTDQGWLPRARQIGITGRSIAPRLFVSVGAHGKFNHMVGVRNAHTIVAINRDLDAPVHDVADVSILGDWRDIVPVLHAVLTQEVERV